MFRDVITKFEDKVDISAISIDSFIDEVILYNTIDEALYDLDEAYMEFYMNNQDIIERTASFKEFIGMNESAESPGTSSWAPDFEKTVYKNIKYKGHILTLEYNHDLQTWFPSIRFRSVVKSLKYIKNEVDEDLRGDRFDKYSKS